MGLFGWCLNLFSIFLSQNYCLILLLNPLQDISFMINLSFPIDQNFFGGLYKSFWHHKLLLLWVSHVLTKKEKKNSIHRTIGLKENLKIKGLTVYSFYKRLPNTTIEKFSDCSLTGNLLSILILLNNLTMKTGQGLLCTNITLYVYSILTILPFHSAL